MRKMTALLCGILFLCSSFVFAQPQHQMIYEDASLQLNDAATNGKQWVICGNGGLLLVSDGLENWTQINLPSNINSPYVVWNGSVFLVFGDGVLYASTDALTWNKISVSDWEQLSPYVTLRSAGNYAFVDEYSNRYVGTRDFRSYYKNYYIGGNFLFTAQGMGQEEYGNRGIKRTDFLRVSEADGSSYPLNCDFYNIESVTAHDGVCVVYGIYSEDTEDTDRVLTFLRYFNTRDFQSWDAGGQRFERKKTGKYLFCANGGEARIFYEGDGAMRGVDNPLLSGGKIYGSDFEEYVSKDGGVLEKTARTIPLDDYRKAFSDDHGNVVLLTLNKVYYAKEEQEFQMYQPLSAQYAIDNEIYHSGKEWINRHSFCISEDGMNWEPMMLSDEMRLFMETQTPRLVWDGTNYISYTANKLQQRVQPTGSVYKMANGFGWLVGRYTTPGLVDDMSYSDGVCYISVPTAYTGKTNTLFYSRDMVKWNKLEEFAEVPAALTEGKWAVLPLYSYKGTEVYGEELIPDSTQLYLMNKKSNKPEPLALQSMQPQKVGTVGNYFYAVTDAWQGSALWISREGIYWHLLKELSDLEDITRVFEKGAYIIAQSGSSRRAVMAVMNKAEFYDEAETLLSGSVSTLYVKIGNTFLGFDTEPVLESDRTLIPLRYMFEFMGANVMWNDDTQTATVSKDGINIDITIDNTIAYVNGEAFELDVPARLMNDRTMIPLRFLSEKLGYHVAWEEGTDIITVTERTKSFTKSDKNDEFVNGGESDAENSVGNTRTR